MRVKKRWDTQGISILIHKGGCLLVTRRGGTGSTGTDLLAFFLGFEWPCASRQLTFSSAQSRFPRMKEREREREVFFFCPFAILRAPPVFISRGRGWMCFVGGWVLE